MGEKSKLYRLKPEWHSYKHGVYGGDQGYLWELVSPGHHTKAIWLLRSLTTNRRHYIFKDALEEITDGGED